MSSLPTAVIDLIGEGDVVLPGQLNVAPSDSTPERRLMCAVMEQAHLDIAFAQRNQRPHASRITPERGLLETLDWFRSRDRSWPYSF